MSKKSPRFVDEFIGEYIGETREEFASNLSLLMGRALEFLKMCDRDLNFARDLLKAQGSQEARRVFVRTVPPYVEGNLNFLRVTPYLYPPLLERLPEDCRVLFAEPMLVLKNRSAAKDSIKRTLVGIGHVAGIPITNDIMGESGAQALMATFELRDSLMHPRSVDGFIVSDDQIAAAHAGVDWFKQKFASVSSPLKDIVKKTSGASYGEA